MDKDLLLNLFKIGNSSGNEQIVADFIKDYFDNMGISYSEDNYGNIFSLEDENLPILNAHMDSVQDFQDEMLSKFIKIRGNIMSGYGVIGGDDKCGIFVILEVLKQRKVNFIITREEEVGCIGINHFMSKFDIKDYPWGLVLDRYGSGDIICKKNDYGTKEFEDALYEVGKSFGYKPSQGVYSDADFISEDISCANISVGYYAHHTKKEYVVLSELQNSINFVIEAIDTIKQKFESPQKYVYRGGHYHHGYDYVDDDFYYFDSSSKTAYQCCITKKKSNKSVFLPALRDYVSPEGAKKIYEDLEQSGLLYEDDSYDFYEEYSDDIDELLKGVV